MNQSTDEKLRVTGGQAVVMTLESLGVTTIFGVASVHNLSILDAVGVSRRVTFVPMRHEQAAAHAADAYARTTGGVGVVVASTGPGTTNTMTGLHEAASASSPVLLVTGQVSSLHYGKNKGALHEADTQAQMLQTVVRKVETAWRVEEIPSVMVEVLQAMLSGRYQPGAVQIPVDIQSKQAKVSRPSLLTAQEQPLPDDAVVEDAIRLLNSSRKPLIYAGGGVISSGAAAKLTYLAEVLKAPVLTTVNGRGAIPETHDLALGTIPARFAELQQILDEADLLLAIGTRFQGPATNSWEIRMPGPMIHLDIDPKVIDLNYRTQVALIGDAARAIEVLSKAIDEEGRDGSFARLARTTRESVRQKMQAEIGADHSAIMDKIRSSVTGRSPIVRDATLPAYLWADRLLPIELPRTSLRPTTGAIGPGFGFALGAALGSGERTVLIIGDGGAMAGLGDIATIGQEGAAVTVCLFNDRGYGVLRAIQQAHAQEEVGVDLRVPDFVDLARSVGITAGKVDSSTDFATRFDKSIREGGPHLIEVDTTQLAQMDLSSFA